MSTGNHYFQPVNLGGIDTFTATGQSGWYQFDVPDALVPVLPGITVPADATGFVLQANTAIAYCFSPEDANLGTTAWLSLPAGGTIVVSGKQWVRQFCVRLGLVAGASFTIQFLQGNIGPILEINAPVTGGINPPPPPGLSAVITENTIHVMKNGNDATGTRNRLDLPFLNVNAAQVVAQPGDTIVVWPGTYTANLFTGGITYHLLGATLDRTDGPTVNCDGVNMNITGFGTITCSFPGAPAVQVFNNGNLKIQANIDSDDIGLGNYGGTLEFRGTVLAKNLGVTGDVGATIRIYGDVRSTDGIAAIFGAADVAMWGNLRGATGGFTSGGQCAIHGNVHTVAGAAAGCDAGRQVIYGILTTDGNDVAICAGGEQIIYGKVVSPASFGAGCIGGVQRIFGDVLALIAATYVGSGGKQILTGRFESQSAAACQVEAGSTLVLSNAVLVTDGANPCVAPQVPGAFDVVVLNAQANTAPDVGINQLVNTITVDANVQ